MPIRIYKISDRTETIAYCSDGEWELSAQIAELEEWLKVNHKVIPKGNYVADIGFTIRKDATGGGGVISIEMMSILQNLGMEIYLSEYGYEFSDME